jgi:hypothetical protein
MRSFTPEQEDVIDLSSLQESSVPAVPELFHVMSRFERPEVRPSKGYYVQTLETYFMVM